MVTQPPPKPLSLPHARFVALYTGLRTPFAGCAWKSYQEVYRCTERPAHTKGALLLKRPDVAAAIAQTIEDQAAVAQVTPARIIRELARMALVDIGTAYDAHGNLLPIASMPDDIRRSIASVEVEEVWEGTGEDRKQTGVTRKVKLWDKRASIETLGKHFKLWIERVEHSADGSWAEVLKQAFQSRK